MSRKITKGGAIDFVRRRFWSHGYSVKTLTNGEEFDILVNGEVKVLVLAKQPGKEDVSDVDIIAYVFRDKLSGGEMVYFAVKGVSEFYRNPKEALSGVSIIKIK